MERNEECDRIFRTRLSKAMDNFGITNASLARAIGVDSSLVSRWRSGQRSIGGNPEYAVLVARYLLTHTTGPMELGWLKRQILLDTGVEDDLSADLANCVSRWLYPCRAFAGNPTAEKGTAALLISSFAEAISTERTQARTDGWGCSSPAMDSVQVTTSGEQTERLLRLYLNRAESGSEVMVYLSSERIRTIRRPAIVETFRSVCMEKRLRACMLLQSANNTVASSQLLATYMPLLVVGQLVTLVTQGVPQSLFGTMGVLIPGQAAITVNETLAGDSDPITTVVTDESHLTDIRQSFERGRRFAHPLMTVFDDHFARNIIEIFFEEYGVPGNLDVIKNGLNPLFFAAEDYDNVLRQYHLPEAEFVWRQQEFLRFQLAMANVLQESVFREVLSLPRLREIARTGVCRMPGIYFFNIGIHEIGAADCAALIEGYIRKLETEPNFSVILLDDEQLFMPNSCWHIKLNKHVMIHSWNTDDPTLIYSDQLILINEFQKHFTELWSKLSQIGFENRQAIASLKEIAVQCRKHIAS